MNFLEILSQYSTLIRTDFFPHNCYISKFYIYNLSINLINTFYLGSPLNKDIIYVAKYNDEPIEANQLMLKLSNKVYYCYSLYKEYTSFSLNVIGEAQYVVYNKKIQQTFSNILKKYQIYYNVDKYCTQFRDRICQAYKLLHGL